MVGDTACLGRLRETESVISGHHRIRLLIGLNEGDQRSTCTTGSTRQARRAESVQINEGKRNACRRNIRVSANAKKANTFRYRNVMFDDNSENFSFIRYYHRYFALFHL